MSPIIYGEISKIYFKNIDKKIIWNFIVIFILMVNLFSY